MRDDSHDSGELPKKVDGLPVAGYRAQEPGRVALVNVNKALEEQILRVMDALGTSEGMGVDPRWLAIARTSIEQGFMALNRAIFRPVRLTDAELERLLAEASTEARPSSAAPSAGQPPAGGDTAART